MTAQRAEILIYKNEQHSLCDEPLSDYFALTDSNISFEWPNTALWRGYIGTWEIQDGKLYLTGLKGWANGRQEVGIEFVFPGAIDKVFAHWVNRRLRATRGRLLEYVHMGYESIYEFDIFFEVKDGIVISIETVNNSN
jgi:hypothetical protein